jgi:uncharacterized protein YndB with AHSA1/START domain
VLPSAWIFANSPSRHLGEQSQVRKQAEAKIRCDRKLESVHNDLAHPTEGGRLRKRTSVIRVEDNVEISRPVEEVFSYTTNPENFLVWAATVVAVRQEKAPGGEGSLDRKGERFTLVQKALGRRFEAPFEVIAYEPNRRYAHQGTEEHPVPVTMIFTFEPLSSECTRFTPRIEAEPGGFFGLVEPVLERAIRRQMRTNLETLKALLEGREEGREPVGEE